MKIVKYESRDGQQISLDFDTIRRFLVQGRGEYVTPQEMVFFMGICKSKGLNPFVRDCYLIKYAQNDTAAIVTSRDYFRKRAKAQKDCTGWQSGIIVERGGQIVYSKGLMLSDDKLLGGWFKAQPRGWDQPFELEVNLNGYIKKTREGTPTRFWSKENQPMMIAKIAESQGLRACWPDEFQSLYSPEEIEGAEMPSIPVEEAPSTTDLGQAIRDMPELPARPKSAPESTISPEPIPTNPTPKEKSRSRRTKCSKCGELYPAGVVRDGLCDKCREEVDNEPNDEPPWDDAPPPEEPKAPEVDNSGAIERVQFADKCLKYYRAYGDAYYGVLGDLGYEKVNEVPRDSAIENKVIAALEEKFGKLE